jgi:arylsulfatase A-like enzyme
MYTLKARELIKQAAAAPEIPRFFYFAIQSVHSPYMAPKEYLDRFPTLPIDGVARRMHAMVAAMDDFVVAVRAELEDTGLWANTLMIVHSDNGAPQAAPHGPGKWHLDSGKGGIQSAGGTAFPLRGAKFNVWEGGTRVPAILSGGWMPSSCAGKESHVVMHVSDWFATLGEIANVSAAQLQLANASGPKPLDSHSLASLLLLEKGGQGQCGADRLASPRKHVLYFYGDDMNGAYAEGDYKIVLGIDNKWGLWSQQWCLAGNYSTPTSDGQCNNPPGPPPCPSAAPCLFNLNDDPREEHDLSQDKPELLAQLLANYRAIGKTDCWRTDPAHGCQTWTTKEQEQALNAQTARHLWLAPIGHAPQNFPPQ